jgi:anti-sigma B factor antagonist
MTPDTRAAHVDDPTIEVSATGSALVLRLAGDLDAASRPAIEPTLIAAVASAPRVIFDLAAVSFCDSTGLAMFITVHEKATADDKPLSLRNVPAHLHRLFEITRADEVLDILE